MVLSSEEGKARRLAGMKRAAREMTEVQKIHRMLVNGRPPAGELKTATAAVTAARVLNKELESRMTAAGLKPKPGDWAVSVGYVSPDLSVLGFSSLYAPGEESSLEQMLTGQIMLGLVFGMVDKQAKEKDERIVMGLRPFFVLKPQTEGWLSELVPAVRSEIELP